MIIETEAAVVDGEIRTDIPIGDLVGEVMGGRIAVLRNVFDVNELIEFRHRVFKWAGTVEPTGYDRPLSAIDDGNVHRIDDSPELSKSPHLFHAYVFNRPAECDPSLRADVLFYFDLLRRFQNSITGNHAELPPSDDPVKLRCQIIQYPVGGGFFARHDHALDPQRIGLILSMSTLGVDYETSGTEFHTDSETVSIEGRHDTGDIALFRYNMPHSVTPVDPGEQLDWSSERGRWTMILPYHESG